MPETVASVTDAIERAVEAVADTAPPAELALMRERIAEVREAMVEEAPEEKA